MFDKINKLICRHGNNAPPTLSGQIVIIYIIHDKMF